MGIVCNSTCSFGTLISPCCTLAAGWMKMSWSSGCGCIDWWWCSNPNLSSNHWKPSSINQAINAPFSNHSEKRGLDFVFNLMFLHLKWPTPRKQTPSSYLFLRAQRFTSRPYTGLHAQRFSAVPVSRYGLAWDTANVAQAKAWSLVPKPHLVPSSNAPLL